MTLCVEWYIKGKMVDFGRLHVDDHNTSLSLWVCTDVQTLERVCSNKWSGVGEVVGSEKRKIVGMISSRCDDLKKVTDLWCRNV